MKSCPKCHQQFEDDVSFCPRDGEVLAEVEAELVGQVLDGKYEVESFIAQGGMGAVYRARHILLGDRVVIKTLRPEMRGNVGWLRRFQREGRAARSFRHPNAVTVYDLSTATDGLIYMVMEFVEGDTLNRELKARGRFAPEAMLEILEPVADVLDAAHARGVVHRDLKPENIMLGRSEQGAQFVKVLDLGIAKMLAAADSQNMEATNLTVAGQILGTPYYMSPEQWGELPRDGNPEIDGRADVYSLGVIAFELIAGRKPLGGRTLPELRQAHVSATLPSIQTFAPDVPEGVGHAIARALAKDRGDRPQTAGEFIDELRAALGLPPVARRTHISTTGAGQARASETGASGVAGANATASIPDAAETIVDGELQPAKDPAATSAQRANRATSADAQPAVGARGSASAISAEPPAAGVDAPVSKSTRTPLIAGMLVGLLLLSVGGWFAWNRMNASKTEEGTKTETSAAATTTASEAAPANVEALSYWVEAFGTSGTDEPKRRAAEALTLASGEYFQFHFTPRERGYLYIVGPGGDGNAPTLFLGAQGGGKLRTNLVPAGADFVFPYGEGASLRLDTNPGAEDYTVILSPLPLLTPAALTREVPYTLKPEELKELEDFRARYRQPAPALAVTGDPEERRAVSVSVPATRDASQPVIFDIRIEHR